jgi:hypothetical protein
MYTKEKNSIRTELGYIVRNPYGNIFCRILVKDFDHSLDPWLLAHYAADEICNRLNGIGLND